MSRLAQHEPAALAAPSTLLPRNAAPWNNIAMRTCSNIQSVSRMSSLPEAGVAHSSAPLPEVAPLQPSSCTPTGPMLSVREVAKRCGLSAATSYRLVDRRALPFYRIAGSVRIAESDLADFLAARRVEPLHDQSDDKI